jgi:hypothetical protein
MACVVELEQICGAARNCECYNVKLPMDTVVLFNSNTAVPFGSFLTRAGMNILCKHFEIAKVYKEHVSSQKSTHVWSTFTNHELADMSSLSLEGVK